MPTQQSMRRLVELWMSRDDAKREAVPSCVSSGPQKPSRVVDADAAVDVEARGAADVERQCRARDRAVVREQQVTAEARGAE